MSKHVNYGKYSTNENETVNPEVKETVEETVAPVETATVQNLESEEPTDAVEELSDGTIIKCTKLNVRETPNLDANVMCVLDMASKVKVDVKNSYGGFFKVVTEAGIEGYCMKEYVAVV